MHEEDYPVTVVQMAFCGEFVSFIIGVDFLFHRVFVLPQWLGVWSPVVSYLPVSSFLLAGVW